MGRPKQNLPRCTRSVADNGITPKLIEDDAARTGGTVVQSKKMEPRSKAAPVVAGPGRLDEVDRALLRALAGNARVSGAALAAITGVAESTVSLRLKRLNAEGYLRGYRADIDVSALGVTVQALISVRLASIVREDIDRFRKEAPHWPGVLALFHMAGVDDFLLHVAARNAADLRDFVLEHLAVHPAIAHTETNLVFDHVAGDGIAELLA
jgi:DNA-binding Lrp family transcriptional regulator